MNFEEAKRLMETIKGDTDIIGRPIDSRGRRVGRLIGKYTRLYYGMYDYKYTPYYDIRYRGKSIIQILPERIWFPCKPKHHTHSDEACEKLNGYLPVGMHVYKEGTDEYGDTKWYLRDMNVTNPDNPDEDVVFHFDMVTHISNDGKVMLYSTKPKYPRVYGEEEE